MIRPPRSSIPMAALAGAVALLCTGALASRLVVAAAAPRPAAVLATAPATAASPAVTGAAPGAVERAPGAESGAPAPRRLPGMQPGGSVLLPTQWSLKPAGEQIVLGDFPVNIAIHPKGKWAAILHSGYGVHEIIVVDLEAAQVASRVTIPQAFYGLAFDPSGARLFASGAEDDTVHSFRFEDGSLGGHAVLKVGVPGGKGVTGGLSCSRDGKALYVASPWGDTVTALALEGKTAARRAALKPDSYPYTTLPSADGRRLYVSLWGRAAVAVLDSATLTLEAEWPTDSHPTELALSPDGARLFVACANSNAVTVLDTKTGRAQEVISSALHPQSPPGSTPNSLALSPDGKVLLIANADNNAIAVADVSKPGASAPLGFIPAGWYPTSVRFGAKGSRIYVANGKGIMPKANRQGPNPMNNPPLTVREYIGGLFRGTLSVIVAPSPADMASYTKQAYACSPLRAGAAVAGAPAEPDSPIPAKVGGASPIKHVLYIIKENRTYDQVLGDMPGGNGDPTLCIFPESVTPNHHALAREFVLLDNFYVESEVSADGHEWSMAAYATDFVEKTWPLVYREGGKDKIQFPGGGAQAIASSAGGYIWDRCREAKLSYRSYGEFVENPEKDGGPAWTRVKALEGHFDPQYRSYDLDYPDQKRADRFLDELKRFEDEGELPAFIVIHLPNDHTYGAKAGKPTPIAYVADNDLALGRIVEAVSRSRFWKETAIFVVEDDAQNGSDHVDAHRTVALVISPWTKRRFVDSNLYSTASMLRTMELILGLAPMSQHDAAALPMYASFQGKADFTPFEHRPARVSLDEKNSKNAWGSRLSDTLDFAKADAADDLLLNEIVWRSVRGADSPMPPPVRASFVFPHPPDRDADDD